MNPKTYKATFRKKNDGLAINSRKGTARIVSYWINAEIKRVFESNLARDGFTIEVVPVECAKETNNG